MLLGLAGYMGSGKSTAAGLLAARGFVVVDADREAKELMQTSGDIQEQLVKAFGERTVQSGCVDFGVLGARVFADIDMLKRLNSIVHPPLLVHLDAVVRAADAANTVLDAALLPLWPTEGRCDRLVWIHASRQVRVSRLQARTGMTHEEIAQRMDMQELLLAAPSSSAWTTIRNEGTGDDLRAKLVEVVS